MNIKQIIASISLIGLALPLGAMDYKSDKQFCGAFENMKKELIVYSQMTHQDEIKVLQKNEKKGDCVICTEGLSGSIWDKTTILNPCGHEFHTQCLISNALQSESKNKNQCSLCRAEFQPLDLLPEELGDYLFECYREQTATKTKKELLENTPNIQNIFSEREIESRILETIKEIYKNTEKAIFNTSYEQLQVAGVLPKTTKTLVKEKSFKTYTAITNPTGYARTLRFGNRFVSPAIFTVLYNKNIIKKWHAIAYTLCVLLPIDFASTCRIYNDNCSDFGLTVVNTAINQEQISSTDAANLYRQYNSQLLKNLIYEIPLPYLMGVTFGLKPYIDQNIEYVKINYPFSYLVWQSAYKIFFEK